MSSPENQPGSQTAVAPLLEELELPPPPDLDEALEPESVVEAAEQLLRESAPHDFDVLVLGAGPGGYVAAIRAAQLGARVGIVEEREIGGVCLNRGCIPTKTLLEAVDVLRLLRGAGDFGIEISGEVRLDFRRMNERKRQVIAQLRGNVEHLLQENGVETLHGVARFVEPHTVEVTGADQTRLVSAVSVIIATGGVPSRLPVPGADLPGVMTSDELLESETVPRHMVTIGGGAVGVEFAYLVRALGGESTLLEMSPAIMPSEDDDIAREMTRVLEGHSIRVLTGAKLSRIEQDGNELRVVWQHDGREESERADLVLMAAGRKANTRELNLEGVGIAHDKGRVLVDENLETSVAGVYAIGDVTRNVGWAHQASAEGKVVAEQIMGYPSDMDLKHVPSCYYTHPEIGTVGQTQQQAEEAGIKTRVGVFPFRANGRAASAGEHEGFVKVVAEAESGKLLGCQIIGPRATDLINEAVMILKNGQTVEDMVSSIHAHPTFSEALPEAALAARK